MNDKQGIMGRAIIRLAAVTAVCGLLAACGASEETHDLSKSDFVNMGYSAQYWPWSVDETTVVCGDAGAVTMKANGITYPLNGTAKGRKLGTGDLNSIWLNDPSVAGLKVNVSDYNHVALGYCGIDSPALH